MNPAWIHSLFQTTKPIIAMCHLAALPGDPGYDPVGGMRAIVDRARRDLHALQQGGVDAVLFSNEFSLPYLTRVEPVTVAAMGRVIGELMSEIGVPFGVDVLWDPIATLDLAAATGARFVREVFSGVYASDFGLWNTHSGAAARHQQRVGAGEVKLLYNIVPEAAAYLAPREIASIARSTVFNNHPDALCVSGLTAGAQTDLSLLQQVKEAAPGTPVFANTGVRVENLEQTLSVADGAVVGTTFKVDGRFENPVDERRVRVFMEKAKEVRGER